MAFGISSIINSYLLKLSTARNGMRLLPDPQSQYLYFRDTEVLQKDDRVEKVWLFVLCVDVLIKTNAVLNENHLIHRE